MLYYFLICLSFLIILNNGAVIKVELNRRILKNNQLNRIERPRNKRSSFGTEDRKMVQLGNQFFGNINDMMYTAKIGIGTPAQIFEMQLDTGSSNIWVVDKFTCLTLNCKGNSRKMFDKTKSSTLKSLNTTYNIEYIKGAMNGSAFSDTIEFTGTGISIKNQDILLADWVDSDFRTDSSDGVFGLSWPGSAGEFITPILELNAVLDKPLFTVYMKRLGILSTNIVEGGGAITYGGIDIENCESDINYVNLNGKMYSRPFWYFDLEGLSIGNYSYESTTMQAISDTGTSFLMGPQEQVDKIYQQIGVLYDIDSDYYVVECDKISKLPSLNLKIGGNSYAIPPDQYVLQFNSTDEYCIVAIESIVMPNYTYWILGDTFIRSYCNIYDVGGQRIGFAKARATIAKRNTANVSKATVIGLLCFTISIFVNLKF